MDGSKGKKNGSVVAQSDPLYGNDLPDSWQHPSGPVRFRPFPERRARFNFDSKRPALRHFFRGERRITNKGWIHQDGFIFFSKDHPHRIAISIENCSMTVPSQ
nr:hypothetical protein Q903MT_gene601 [Picea sitchensis]